MRLPPHAKLARACALPQARHVSTWKLAAGGLQRKWKGLKQRTAWRFKTLKDRNALIVFSADAQKEKEIYLNPRTNRYIDDPLACHNVLLRVSPESLNGILSATSPEHSSQYVKTMTGFMLHSCRPRMRAKILEVIAYQRLDEISITNRAVIIRAIQRCLLSPLHMEKAVLHAAACNILKSTYGKDLSLLKEQIHSDDDLLLDDTVAVALEAPEEIPGTAFGHDHDHSSVPQPSSTEPAEEVDLPHSGDLSQLLYTNRNVTEVVQVMQHIAIESLKVKEEYPNLIKVVSDIDDTLYPGWLDRRYPLYVPYPGVSELYARISRGIVEDARASASDLTAKPLPPPITFLTARPRGWLSMGRYLTVQHLRSLGVPNPTVLHGSVKGLVSNKKIAEVKLENFTRFASLFPEFKFVFFGDSGQGDALLASRLLTTFPRQVLATFIHDVNPAFAKTGDGGVKHAYEAQGVEFFSTYPAAARGAYEKGLLARDDVVVVTQAAQDELAAMPFLGSDAQVKKSERTRELEADATSVLETVDQATRR